MDPPFNMNTSCYAAADVFGAGPVEARDELDLPGPGQIGAEMSMSGQAADVTRYGVLDMQVCVPAGWSDEEVEAFAERENPSGTNGWTIRRKGDAALGGDPERNPCGAREGYVHVTLDA